jgi:glutamate synthase (NADPH/NADH) large chain
MTVGKAIILGDTGRNFAAGMSGGVAYVFDRDGEFESRCNMEMVKLGPVDNAVDITDLKSLIENHLVNTKSDVAQEILDDWSSSIGKFVRVMPVDYERMLGYMEEARATGKFEGENDIAEEAFDMHMRQLAAK